MGHIKYARAEVLSTHWAPQRVDNARLASIGKTASLLEKTKHDKFLTDDGYLYVTVRAISSRVNRNNDSWPADELQRAYRTFEGKPIFVDHRNHDPKRARGIVVDSAVHVDDEKLSALDPFYGSSQCESYHNPPTWVELLLEVDAKRFPKLAKAFIDGKIDAVSMGALVEFSDCNICNNRAYEPQQFCSHILAKGAEFNTLDHNGQRTSKKSAEVCRSVTFFEISAVFDPADTTALVKGIRAANADDPRDGIGIDQLKSELMQAEDAGDRQRASDIREQIRHLHERAAHNTEDEMAATDQQPNFRNPEDQNLIIAARQSYQQAISEGADNLLAVKSALTALKSEGVDKDRAVDIARLAVGERIAGSKTADRQNDDPQADMKTAPDMIDTLRQERPCPVCGSSGMVDGACPACFTPDTMVRTRDGYVPISTIEVGDEVLTEDGGYRKVAVVHENEYEGFLYEIDTHSTIEPIRATPNHPFKALVGQHTTRKADACKPGRCNRLPDGIGLDKWGNVTVTHGMDWVEAEDLTADSYVVLHAPKQTFDLDRVVVPQEHRGTHNRRGPVEFELTPDFLWAAGMYLAEGSTSTRSINFSLHRDEVAYQERLRSTFEHLGYNVSVSLSASKQQSAVVEIHSSTLAEWLPRWLGHLSHNKSIPAELLNLPDEKLDHVVQGVLDGDGGKTHQRLFDQTSPHLAMQVSEYTLRRGGCPSAFAADRPERKRSYTVHGAETATIEKVRTKATKKHMWQYMGSTLTKVKSIKQVPYFGKVYNLTVEGDPTYVVQNHLVHNCQYVEPPEGFDNPDLDRAKQIEDALEQSKAENALEQQTQGQPGMQPGGAGGAPQAPAQPPQQQMAASWVQTYPKVVSSTSVTGEHIATSSERNLDGGRVNTREKPLLPPGRKPSDKPKEIQVVKDYSKPVESRYRVLAADAPAGEGAEKRVDGGGKGGVGLDTDHAKKDNTSREADIERIHTKTWSGNEGDSLGQQSPVTTEVFEPFKAAGVKVACDNKDCDGDCDECKDAAKEHEAALKQADATPAKGNGGWPDHEPSKVDLEGGLTEEVGPPTETWGDHGDSLGQQDPVTKEPFGDHKWSKAAADARAHMLACFKLAETEVALGITQPEMKFARVGELESESRDSLKARLDALVQARKASAISIPARKTVAAVPPPVRMASVEATSNGGYTNLEDQMLFC